jgi:hypothetical protein
MMIYDDGTLYDQVASPVFKKLLDNWKQIISRH